MSKVIFLLQNCTRFSHQTKHFDKIKHLQAACDDEDREAEITDEGEAVERRFAVDIGLAYAALSSAKVLVLRALLVLLQVQQIDPKVEHPARSPALNKDQFDPNPLIKCHGEQKRQKCERVKEAHQNQAIASQFFAHLVELMNQFLFLCVNLLTHSPIIIYMIAFQYYNAHWRCSPCPADPNLSQYRIIQQPIIRTMIQKSNPSPSESELSQKISEYQPNLLTKQVELSSFIGFKCTHIIFFICWFGLVLAGTTIIGFGASNYSKSFSYCDDGQPFCFYDVTLDQTRDLFIYAKFSPFNQNNRMYFTCYSRYLDAYSVFQLAGHNGTGAQCGNYKTYGSLGKVQTSGGYRVNADTNAHPCGFPMLTLLNDSAYIVQSDGGTPYLGNGTISNYSKTYHFKSLSSAPASQWTDVEQSNFVNWFTTPTTSTKYVLMGKLSNMSGDYRLIIKNSYPTNGEFTKQVILSEVNSLGVTNHLLGFALFAYGIGMLLVHVAICCKSRD